MPIGLPPHRRQRRPLIPIRPVETQHRLMGIAAKTKLAEDLAQFFLMLRQRGIETLDARRARLGDQRLKQAKPYIRIGWMTLPAAIGRHEGHIVFGAATTPNRLHHRAKAAFTIDEGRPFVGSTFQQAAERKPEWPMRQRQHRVVIQHHLTARLLAQRPDIA